MKIKYFLQSVVMMLFYFSTFAQQKEITLNPLTITASLEPLPNSKSGRNIVVISRDDIAQMPVNSLDEVLKYVAGIEVQQRGPMGAQSDIVLRGGTFQQVLVLLDGMRINDPITGHFNSYIPVSLVEIERIEILKGAASALYGSEAVGGVIHVITKTFAQAERHNEKVVHAQVSAGEYGLVTASAAAHIETEKWRYNISGQSNNASGQQQRGIRGYFHNNTVSASASKRINEYWRLSARVAYDSRDFAAQNFYTVFASDTAKEKVQSLWAQASLKYQKKKNDFQVGVSYKRAKDEYLFNP